MPQTGERQVRAVGLPVKSPGKHVWAAVLALGVGGPAQAGLFDTQQRPWHLRTKAICEESIAMQSGPDTLYWETVLPGVSQNTFGLKLKGNFVRETNFPGMSYFAVVPATLRQQILAAGKTPFVADKIDMSPTLRNKIAQKARFYDKALDDTAADIEKLFLLILLPSVKLAGLPAGGVKVIAGGALFYKWGGLIKSIAGERRLNLYTGVIPEDGEPQVFKADQLATFFYTSPVLQRTYSIFDDPEEVGNQWFTAQISIATTNPAGQGVLIPFLTCKYPIKP